MEIKNRMHLCLILSGTILMVALIMTLTGHGFNTGIDFTGGILIRYEIGQDFIIGDISKAISQAGYKGVPQISKAGSNQTEVQIRIKDVNDFPAFRDTLDSILRTQYPGFTDLAADPVGAVAGRSWVLNAIGGVLLAAGLMLIYIIFRFNLFSGLAAIIGLVHDILLMCSFTVLFRSFIQVNTPFIAVCLTLVGYSMINSIVLFDRIRENIRKAGNKSHSREEIANQSIRETLGRMSSTTATMLIIIISLYILGVGSIREFTLPLFIGICASVYSTILINGYVWAWLAEVGKNWKLRPKKA